MEPKFKFDGQKTLANSAESLNVSEIVTSKHKESVIDKVVIDQILNRVPSIDEEGGHEEFDSYFIARDLSGIFQKYYLKNNNDEVEHDKTDNPDLVFLYADHWEVMLERCPTPDIYLLWQVINMITDYEDRFGHNNVRDLIRKVAYRWEIFLDSAHDSHDAYARSSRMKQIVFVSLLSQIREGSSVEDFDDSDYIELEIVESKEHSLSEKGNSLNDVDIYQMEMIYRANYHDNEELEGVLVNNFLNKVRDNKGTFVVMRFSGQIIGFYELDEKKPGKIYFSKFNVAPGLYGAGFGAKLLQKKLNIEAREKIVFAESDLLSDSTINYLKNGFIAYGANFLAEIVALSLVRNDKKREILNLGKVDRAAIVKQYHADSSKSFEINDVVVLMVPWWDIPYAIGTGIILDKINGIFEKRINGKRYVMTTVFNSPISKDDPEYEDGASNKNDTYFVFQLVEEGKLDEYRETQS